MILGFWTTLGIWAVTFVAQRLMRGKPQQQAAKSATLGDLNLPRAEEGAAVPLFWGQTMVRSPNLIWWGQFETTTQGGSSNIEGEAIKLSLDFAIGMPAEDGNPACRLVAFFIDERKVYAPGTTGNTGAQYLGRLGDPDHRIDIQHLTFWGPVEFNGELAGEFQFFHGGFGLSYPSAPNNLPVEVFDEESSLDSTILPTYRGLARVFFKGLKLGQNLTLPAFAFEVATYPNRLSLDSAPAYPEGGHKVPTAEISEGTADFDANPAEVLYDILTNAWGRLGLPASRVDSVSFKAVGDTLATENHGFSFTAYNAVDAREITQEILEEIDAVMYEDPENRQIKLKLIRNDYTVGSLDLFDESNVLRVEKFATSTWEQTYNQVRVNYTDRRSNYATRSQFAQDGARIAASGDVPRTAQFNYPGIHSATVAQKVAARELNALSRPLAQLTLVVNRDGYTLRPGDVFRFSWAKYGIVDMVLRVTRYSLGSLQDNEIRLECVEDRWAVDHTVFEPNPDPINPPLLPAIPKITERVLFELPRWMGYRASTTPQTRDVVDDAQDPHVAYVAKLPSGVNVANFRAEASDDSGVTYEGDIDIAPFVGHATVDAVYPRTADPYDTSTGLTIANVSNESLLGSASSTQIQETGKNLIMVGPDEGPYEFMAYEAAADLGGGQFELQSVWRGLLDTVPVRHSGGENVWLIAADTILTENVGRLTWAGDEEVLARLLTRTSFGMLDPLDAPVEKLTLLKRALRTYPVADLTVDGAKSVVLEDSNHIDVAWKRRDRTSTTIVRGDAADETPPDTPQQFVEIRDEGSEDSWLLLDGPINDTESEGVELGGYGAGEAELRVRSQSTPESTALNGLQHPEISVDARHYRQLLRNPTFGTDGGILNMEGWTVNDGQAALTENEGRRFVGAASSQGRFEMEQVVDVSGYDAEGLTARLFFIGSELTSDDDTLEVTLEALDDMDSVLDSDSFNADNVNLPSAFKQTLSLVCPADTAKLRVEVVADLTGEFEDPQELFAEPDLRLGSLTTQQLSDEDFDALTAWTQAAGSWASTFDTSSFTSFNHAAHTNSGTAELQQDVTIPAGYEYAAVMLWWWDRFPDANTGSRATTTIEARDGGGVNQSVDTGEIQPTQDDWDKRTLYISELDGQSDTIRVRLEVSTWSSSSRPNWDTMQLLFCQEHASSWLYTLDLSEPVGAGEFPTTRQDWRDSYDEDVVPFPNFGWWTGSSATGLAGVEPTMTVNGGTSSNVGGKGWNPVTGLSSDPSTRCFEFDDDTDDISGGSTAYANFDKSESFSIFVALKSKQEVAGARDILGRMNTSGDGWRVAVDGSGNAYIEIDDGSNNQTATGTEDIFDGAPHGLVFGYDADTDEVFVRDESGETRADASSVNDFSIDSLFFRLGRSRTDESTLACHIAAVFIWTDVVIDATQYAALWAYGNSPTSESVTVSRTGLVAAVSGESGGNQQVGRYPDGAFATARLDGAFGLVASKAFHNEAPTSDPNSSTYWTSLGSATVTTEYASDMEGFQKAVAIESDNTTGDGYELDTVSLGLSSAGSVWVGFGVRSKDAGATHGFEVELFNSSGTSKGSVSGSATDDWVWTWFQFTGWDGSTANATLRFRGSDDGTSRGIEISGPVAVVIDDVKPVAWPVSRDGTEGDVTAIEPSISGLSTIERFNNEGELRVTGAAPADAAETATLANLHNGTDDDERRRLEALSGDGLRGTHWDGAGASAQSTAGGASNDWAQTFTAKLRWNRAGVREDAAVYAQTRFEGNTTASSSTRVSSPTLERTSQLDEMEIGHDGGASNWTGIISEVQLRAREGSVTA